MFTDKDQYACIGDTITCKVDGFDVVARIEHDEDCEPPWNREDGHGPVSDWTTRQKEPGERVLCEDRGSRRYYNVQEATALARRDGWDTKPFGQGTVGERAARAVEADFNALRLWCAGEWGYCGVVLSVARAGVVLDDHAAGLWGIDIHHPNGDSGYLLDVANELLPEAVEEGHKLVEKVCCLATA